MPSGTVPSCHVLLFSTWWSRSIRCFHHIPLCHYYGRSHSTTKKTDSLSLKDPCNSVWARGLGTKPENRYHSVLIQRVSTDHELSPTLDPGPSTLSCIKRSCGCSKDYHLHFTEEKIVLPKIEKPIQGITICKYQGYDRVLGAKSALSP